MQKPIVIAGPCAVESKEQIALIAEELSKLGIKYLRGGCFKPRTNYDSFQGLGKEGLLYLKEAADKHGMLTVSEVMTESQLHENYDQIDVIQIGARNMMSYGLLKEVGKKTAEDKKPVILKRGMEATIPEMIGAAEYITKQGNPNVIFCLRGIRTFEQIDSCFRNTPDLASILELKEKGFTVIFDPSHSAGNTKYILPLVKAALSLGADGYMVEVHNCPEKALCDGKQSLTLEDFSKMLSYISSKV